MKPFIKKKSVKLTPIQISNSSTTENQSKPLSSPTTEGTKDDNDNDVCATEEVEKNGENVEVITGDEKTIKNEIEKLDLSKSDKNKLIQIYKTCNYLCDLSKKIKELEDDELPISELDNDESNFIKLGKAEERFNKTRKELCSFLKKNNHLKEYFYDINPNLKSSNNLDYMFTLRKSYAFIKFNETNYKQINQEIEKLINKEMVLHTPDYQDIYETIDECNKKYKLKLSDANLESIAKSTFTQVATLIRKHREIDHKQIMSTRISFSNLPEDPAKNNKEIEEKLNKNKREYQLKFNKIIDEYAKKSNSNDANNDEEDIGEESEEDDDEENDDEDCENTSLFDDEETLDEEEPEETAKDEDNSVTNDLPQVSNDNNGESLIISNAAKDNENTAKDSNNVLDNQNTSTEVTNEISNHENEASNESSTQSLINNETQHELTHQDTKKSEPRKKDAKKSFKRASDLGIGHSNDTSEVKKSKYTTRRSEFKPKIKSTIDEDGCIIID